jgi:DNA-binding GntR family transcriptional regulator
MGDPDGSVSVKLIYQSIGTRLPRQGRVAPVHRAIYDAARNPHFGAVLRRYDNLATRMFCMFLDRLPTVATHVGEHGPLLCAIAAGDGQKVAHLAHDHVTGFEAAIRTVI